MYRGRTVLMMSLLGASAAAPTPGRLPVASGPVVGGTLSSAPQSKSPSSQRRDPEFQTEQQLLVLANESRQQHGAPALTLDAGLSRAALIHAQAMLEARQLSHQFDGEPSLPERLAA